MIQVGDCYGKNGIGFRVQFIENGVAYGILYRLPVDWIAWDERLRQNEENWDEAEWPPEFIELRQIPLECLMIELANGAALIEEGVTP